MPIPDRRISDQEHELAMLASMLAAIWRNAYAEGETTMLTTQMLIAALLLLIVIHQFLISWLLVRDWSRRSTAAPADQKMRRSTLHFRKLEMRQIAAVFQELLRILDQQAGTGNPTLEDVIELIVTIQQEYGQQTPLQEAIRLLERLDRQKLVAEWNNKLPRIQHQLGAEIALNGAFA